MVDSAVSATCPRSVSIKGEKASTVVPSGSGGGNGRGGHGIEAVAEATKEVLAAKRREGAEEKNIRTVLCWALAGHN
jgi:hypothetical protein